MVHPRYFPILQRNGDYDKLTVYHILEFINHEGSENPILSEIAIQTNNLANETARLVELKKIELRIRLAESDKANVEIFREKIRGI